jgi:uncharacterized protein involved in type VI secretion and phage assembly
MSSDLLARLVEKVEGRFYGKHRATVVDNADPENRGRLRLRIPSVLGNDVVSGWALPCAPFGGAADQGFFFIPEVEATVWVEFEMGNPDFPVWVGTFWGKPGGATEVPKINDAEGVEQGEAQNPPTRKVIKTVKGHTIQLEDADGDEMVMLLEAVTGNLVVMNSDGIKVTDSKNETTITLDKDGLRIQAAKGIELKTDGDINLDAANVKVKVAGSMDVS